MEKITDIKITIWTHSRMPDRQVQRTMNAIAEVLQRWEPKEDETGITNFQIFEV